MPVAANTRQRLQRRWPRIRVSAFSAVAANTRQRLQRRGLSLILQRLQRRRRDPALDKAPRLVYHPVMHPNLPGLACHLISKHDILMPGRVLTLVPHQTGRATDNSKRVSCGHCRRLFQHRHAHA